MQKGERTRETILARAHTLASISGLDGLTIGALAADTGLSKSGLFAHFGSKEALQTAVLRAAGERVSTCVLAPALRHPTGIARLRALFANWLEWDGHGSAGGCLLVAAAVELDDRDGSVRETLVALQRDWLASLTRIAARAQRDGDFRADLDREQFAHDLQSVMLGYHFAKRLMRDPEAERRAHTALERLITDAKTAEADDAGH